MINQQRTNKEGEQWLSVSRRDHSFSAPQKHNQFIISTLAFVMLGFMLACHDSIWLQRRVWFTETEHPNKEHNQTKRERQRRQQRQGGINSLSLHPILIYFVEVPSFRYSKVSKVTVKLKAILLRGDLTDWQFKTTNYFSFVSSHSVISLSATGIIAVNHFLSERHS